MKRNKWIFIILALIVLFLGTFAFFYMRTATASEPSALNLTLSGNKKTIQTGIRANTITIILYDSDKIYCYNGNDIKTGNNFSYSKQNSIRNYLLQKKNEIPDSSLLVLIKPASSASHKNTIDILDEMSIDGIKKYAMIDLDSTEETFIKNVK